MGDPPELSMATTGIQPSDLGSPQIIVLKVKGPNLDYQKVILNSMYIGENEFHLGSGIEVRRDENGSPVLDHPHVRYNNVKGLKLNKHGLGPFVFLRLSSLPMAQGVYAVVADGKEILYIGQSADTIRNRWQMGYASIQPRNCFQNGQSTNCRLNNLIYSAILVHRKLELYVLATTDYERVEKNLIAMLQPAWNVQGIR